MTIKNKLCSSILVPVLFIMVKIPHSKHYHWFITLCLLLIPICFLIFFGLMEDKMWRPRSLFSLPTPFSVIPLYPSRLPLVDLNHFFYLINNDVCGKQKVFLVVLVHTHPSNRELRDSMRKNIPLEDLVDMGIRRIFLMARAEWDDQEKYHGVNQDVISEENVLHGDIIQGNFKEHYKNLTYKHIMGLQWVGRFCPQAKYIIKMDDDIIVDLYQFRDFLKYRFETRTNLILGLLQIGAKPIRDKKSKWYVDETTYPDRNYANFVSGWAYAISADAANKLVNVSSHFPYFWIDDIHVTGTLAENQMIKREGLNMYYTLHRDHLKCCVTLPKHGDYLCDFFVGPSEEDTQLMGEVLRHARHCYINTCLRRPIELRISKTCVTSYVHPMAPAGTGVGEIAAIERSRSS